MRACLRFLLAALAIVAAPLTACADPVSDGKAVFEAQCALCHDASPAKGAGQGPPLFGLVGRKVGSAAGFDYSDALKTAGKAGKTWDAAGLDAFLSDPQKAMPGTQMPVSVPDVNDRKVLIAYLTNLNDGSTQGKSATGSGTAMVSDWRGDAPGVRHRIDVAKLPAPYASESAGNSPAFTQQSDSAVPQVPAGFAISLFASGLERPRQIRMAPNGDLFVTEARRGRIRVFHNRNGTLDPNGEIFVGGLNDPFGVAFYPLADPKYVYVSSPTSITRYAYVNGDGNARGAAENVVTDLSTGGGHSSRDIVFSPDGKYLYAAIGSGSNVAEGMPDDPPGGVASWEASHGRGASWGAEDGRALVLRFDPDGHNRHVIATGIRNCSSLGMRPGSGDLYCTTNERDGLGDDLVPDYFTRVQNGQFFGWPWFYLGAHPDPRHKGERGDLAGAISMPDLLFAAHSAPLGFIFYQAPRGAAHAFPAQYTGDVFVAFHGSWNRAQRTGSKVVRVLMKNGKPTGEYEDFMTGLVLTNKTVAGRPVGVAVGPDGALYVSDDASGRIWRIAPK